MIIINKVYGNALSAFLEFSLEQGEVCITSDLNSHLLNFLTHHWLGESKLRISIRGALNFTTHVNLNLFPIFQTQLALNYVRLYCGCVVVLTITIILSVKLFLQPLSSLIQLCLGVRCACVCICVCVCV